MSDKIVLTQSESAQRNCTMWCAKFGAIKLALPSTFARNDSRPHARTLSFQYHHMWACVCFARVKFRLPLDFGLIGEKSNFFIACFSKTVAANFYQIINVWLFCSMLMKIHLLYVLGCCTIYKIKHRTMSKWIEISYAVDHDIYFRLNQRCHNRACIVHFLWTFDKAVDPLSHCHTVAAFSKKVTRNS